MIAPMPDVLDELVQLTRLLGDPSLDLAILAEGNASARRDDATFYVKGSGLGMQDIHAEGMAIVRMEPILSAMDGRSLDDAEVRELLSTSRADGVTARMPSVETFMHAFLLSLPDVLFVGHTHPTPLLSLLSLQSAPELAVQRLFPDEIVCCGPATCFVPYSDPGLPLARAIRNNVRAYIRAHGETPKTIWLQNHGLIALGRSPREVESATRMGVKAARVWLGAMQTGQPLHPLTPTQIARIHTRPDEHYRQRLLWAVG